MSGLVATNDKLVREFLNDKKYMLLECGTLLTCVSRQGHTTDTWRVRQPKYHLGYATIIYKKRSLSIHRLLYAAFIGPLNRNLVINHKDNNRSNNSLSNLELVTNLENIQHYHNLKNST